MLQLLKKRPPVLDLLILKMPQKSRPHKKAPTEIKLSIDTITEGSSNLLIGNLQTVDSDQQTERFNEIVDIVGTDFKNFSMNKDTGAFSFKETPVAGSYKVIIKSTDAGGKSFAKEEINVQKIFAKMF